ncbi:MAG: META domain-containing protein [Chitinophagales bacterium]|nr:META domain-containing protein [Chitinophagales bacterium]
MKKIVLIISLFICPQAFSSDYLKVLYVADQYHTIGTNKYLMTRETPTDTFSIFYENIAGFTYETGYTYCLLTTVSKNTDTSTNITTYQYSLSEIKSKIKTQNSNLETNVKKTYTVADSSTWLLYKLRMKDGSTKTFSLQKAYIRFDIKNNTISGNSDCNELSASFTMDSSSILFENISTTKMKCGKHAIEPIFIQMLQQATNYRIKNKQLLLFKGKSMLGLFTRKKD